MTLSRSARIILLLAIDIFFFFVELIVGYAVGSLALVADSFHMLNDVMSLIVALFAIKLTVQNSPDSRYTYGWHRAEILAALINGVFLLALCFSIFLEAIERFFSTPEISNPRLVVIVGSLGLASNFVGLFLFHEHGHSHGHSHNGTFSKAASIRSVTPEHVSGDATPRPGIPVPIRSGSTRSRSASYSSLYGHPVATRASLVQAANDMASHAHSLSPASRTQDHFSHRLEDQSVDSLPENINEHTPLLIQQDQIATPVGHEHAVPSATSSDGRNSHIHPQSGSMNMRALVLHVMGDALGNVGVIATGFVIWFSDWKYKYFFDPVVSLVITVIIFSSALPLVRSASFILLQGVPASVSIEEVRASILAVDGVHSLHELHIWQLSETKIVASVHVTASRDHDFMLVASKIRNALHQQGIHSSTIQPEYHCPQTAPSDTQSKRNSCLITCPADQGCDPSENSCCPPPHTDV